MTTPSSSEPLTLGPVAHIGLVVADVAAAMTTLGAAGTSWSAVTEPDAMLRLPTGRVVRERVTYVAQSGGEPRLKLIGGAPDGYFAPPAGDTAVHHLSHWVEDLSTATERLVAAGYVVEATGLEADAMTPRYVYLVADGLVRIELGLAAHRAEFDAWADGAPGRT